MVKSETLVIQTKGNCHIVDITAEVREVVAGTGMVNGTVTVFNVGSTAGVTTIEYEPGLVKHDINAAFEIFAPQAGRYEHEETWHDDNGHAHVRASMLGPSLVVPFCEQNLGENAKRTHDRFGIEVKDIMDLVYQAM